jgi:CubicO group peptidase (beta-lactamase class C family)
MNRRVVLVICAPLVVVVGCTTQRKAEASDPCAAHVVSPGAADAARAHLRSIAEQDPAPGLAVAVVRDGRLVWSEGFGHAHVAGGEPVCRSTRFRAGSVSKVLTGVALLRMGDAGAVDLDADVRDLVPQVAWQPGPITLRQLAGHLGGIRHYGAGEYFNMHRYERVADALEIFSGDSLRSVPGATYHYSSYGYNLLGAALEAAADTPYAALVRTTVLEPLALAHTNPESEVTVGGMATPYVLDGDTLVEAPPFDPSDRLPSGGWVASAEDVARLGAALLYPDFVSDESRTLMLSSQRTSGGAETGYSVGLRIVTDARGRLIAHHGGTSVGARAFLLVYPDERLSVALMGNGPARFDEEDVARIAASFLRH